MLQGRIRQPEYDRILRLMPIVCVDVAIEYNDAILLIKRRDEPAAGQWWLPGGRLYKGEELRACALRKAREETGLDCREGPVIYYASTDFGSVHSVNFCFLLYARDDQVKLDDTCLDHKWVASTNGDYHDYIYNCLRRAF